MRFRFETLLQVHQNKENLLQKELGDILEHMQNQKTKQNSMRGARSNYLKQINQRMKQDLNVETYLLYNSFFEGNHLQDNQQQVIISEIDDRAKAKRQELVEVRRKRRTMEIIKERDINAYKKKLDKIETVMMDEIASNHWRLNS